METFLSIFVSIFCSVMASSGLWALLAKRMDRSDAKTELLIGMAHDRISFLGVSYTDRGYITQEEYENINTYLYEPLKKVTGGVDLGFVERIMKDVNNLEIRKLERPNSSGNK